MAIFESIEYARVNTTIPPGTNYAWGARPRQGYFSYVQVANGNIGDEINLMRLDCQRTVVEMFRTWLAWSAWTAGATFSLGWRAYTDMDGAAVVASAAGLLSGVALDVAGAWSHGMLVVATPNDSLPVVNIKAFNNRTPVVIYATINATAPAAADTFEGSIGYVTP